MKRILLAIMMMVSITAMADDNRSFGDFRTLKLALTQARYENPAIQLKVLKTLAKYQFSTDTPTHSMSNAVIAQFNFTGFMATAATNINVYLYDYSLPKARPNEPDSMSQADLDYLKSLVDDDPQITIDCIRNSETDAWLKENGISKRPKEEPK